MIYGAYCAKELCVSYPDFFSTFPQNKYFLAQSFPETLTKTYILLLLVSVLRVDMKCYVFEVLLIRDVNGINTTAQLIPFAK